MGTWVKCEERLPPRAGLYRVIRRTLCRRRQEDMLRWEPIGAEWKNARGQRVRAVEEWNEEAAKDAEAGAD